MATLILCVIGGMVGTPLCEFHSSTDRLSHLHLIPIARDYIGEHSINTLWPPNLISLIEGMWLILQQETAEDFVLATGEMHTVREFVEKSFGVVGITIR